MPNAKLSVTQQVRVVCTTRVGRREPAVSVVQCQCCLCRVRFVAFLTSIARNMNLVPIVNVGANVGPSSVDEQFNPWPHRKYRQRTCRWSSFIKQLGSTLIRDGVASLVKKDCHVQSSLPYEISSAVKEMLTSCAVSAGVAVASARSNQYAVPGVRVSRSVSAHGTFTAAVAV